MANLTWRNKVQQTPPSKTADELIQDIATSLKKNCESGTISIDQLIKISNLATDTGRLASLLTWL